MRLSSRFAGKKLFKATSQGLIVPIMSLLQHHGVDFIAKIRRIDTLSPSVLISCTYSMHQVLLQSEEELMKKRSSELTGKGTAPKPKKMVGKMKVQVYNQHSLLGGKYFEKSVLLTFLRMVHFHTRAWHMFGRALIM